MEFDCRCAIIRGYCTRSSWLMPQRKHCSARRWREKPRVATSTIITESQIRLIRSMVTCSPWQPTSVKNAERNALRLRGRDRGQSCWRTPGFRERGSRPEYEGDRGSDISADTAFRTYCQRHQSARVARGEKAGGFEYYAHLIEQTGRRSDRPRW